MSRLARRRAGRGFGSGLSSPVSTINVTPMVDVMLVMLIIFLIMTPLIAAGFQAELPQAPGVEPKEARQLRVVLGIDASGDYFLDGTPVEHAELAGVLEAIYSLRASDKILYVEADRHLRFQRVLDAIAVARAAGVRVVAAVTEDRSPPESQEAR